MSLVAPILESPVSAVPARVSSAAVASWFEVRHHDLPLWNNVLLDTDTSLYQYPFWNEPYRPLWLTPRYLAWGTQDRPLAFVSILTIGFGPAKIGLVFRGPSCIHSQSALCDVAVAELITWARSHGYIFIRFTHSDPQVRSCLTASSHVENFDAFPFFLDYPVLSPDYVVEQCDDDDEMLASFDREARRKLRRTRELGYEFQAGDSPQALATAWPIYQDCARRKHFRLERPLSVYMETMRLAREHNCVRLYSVHLNGKMMGSTLVFRDRTTAHSLLAAFDADHRHAAVFLHWHAMRDMYRQGAHRYNLGPAPGSLARFKQQFCKAPDTSPGVLTVVLNERLFQVWRNTIFPVARNLRPTLRKIVSWMKS
jgi:Acetyltransferase (GNAT) domain